MWWQNTHRWQDAGLQTRLHVVMSACRVVSISVVTCVQTRLQGREWLYQRVTCVQTCLRAVKWQYQRITCARTCLGAG